MVARPGRSYRRIRYARLWEPQPGGHLRGGAATGAGASVRCCKGAGAAAEYCTRAGVAAKYCTGAGAAAEYCRGAGAASEYCTAAEECVVESTAPVR